MYNYIGLAVYFITFIMNCLFIMCHFYRMNLEPNMEPNVEAVQIAEHAIQEQELDAIVY